MNHSASSALRRAVLPRLVFALLLVSVLFVYAPARTRFFVMDHLMYQAELDGERSWAAGLRLLDYSAARQFSKGDELLYRPLLMAWLAAQNTLLQLNYRAWNAANLFAHLLVVWLLFEALWRLRRSPFAHVFALGFALLASNFELVTWNHLGGYMLGYGLLLVAILALREANLHPDRPRIWWLYGLAIAAAMLFHEIAVIAAAIALPFAVPFLRRHPGAARCAALLALLAPLLLYFALYAGHVARCERWLWIDASTAAAASPWTLPLQMFYAWKVWILRILAPAAVEYGTHPYYRSGTLTPVGIGPQMRILLQFCLWAGIGLSFYQGVVRSHLQSVKSFAAGVALVLVAYTAMNCWGRNYAYQVAYYPYFFALFGTLLAYSLFDFDRIGKKARLAALVLLAVLCIFNAERTHRISRRVEQEHARHVRYFDAIDKQVRHRLEDPAFTFGIQNPPRDLDLLFAIPKGYPGQNSQTRVFSVMDALYGRRYTHFLPSVWLSFADQ